MRLMAQRILQNNGDGWVMIKDHRGPTIALILKCNKQTSEHELALSDEELLELRDGISAVIDSRRRRMRRAAQQRQTAVTQPA